MTTLMMIAKQPIPGRVKTRLHPPLSLEDAAVVAAAAIDTTIDALATLRADRRILLFEGETAPTSARGWDVLPQSTGDLDERLAAAFDECDGPTLLVGMDTPQITAEMLAPAFAPWPSGVDSWFGAAVDGGFWALAMAEPDGSVIRGVPMSRDDTGAIQLQRLREAGLTVAHLPELLDVDTIDAAMEVARLIPESPFARAVTESLARADRVRDAGLVGVS